MKNAPALILSMLLVLALGVISMACEDGDAIYRCDHYNPYSTDYKQCFEFTEGTSEEQAAEWCENLTIGIRVLDPQLAEGKCDWEEYDPAGFCDCEVDSSNCLVRHETYDGGYVRGIMIAEVSETMDDPETDCKMTQTFSSAWGCDQWGGIFICNDEY